MPLQTKILPKTNMGRLKETSAINSPATVRIKDRMKTFLRPILSLINERKKAAIPPAITKKASEISISFFLLQYSSYSVTKLVLDEVTE